MKELKIICGTYSPNSAMTNRLMALLRGFLENGIKVNIAFAHPNEKSNKMEWQPDNMTVKYLWEGHAWHYQPIRRLYGFRDVYNYAKTLKPGDKVLLIGSGQFLPLLVNKDGVDVYHERTEHPDVVKVIPHFMQGRYLKACTKLKGMFVISTALKKHFESIGIPNVSIINMIVDSTRFEDLQKHATKEKQIVYCGKGTNNKDGVDELIKAFSLVNKKHPDAKLLIVGKAPKAMDKSGNLELVRELGLTDKVVFTGKKPAEEIPQILKNADCCVLDRPDSLQAQYGFPTKLGEYLLSGNPVVITKVGDIPLFLSHKENALLAEERNTEDFAKQLCWVLENPEEAKKIGEKGRLLAIEKFNYKIESEKMVNVIFQ